MPGKDPRSGQLDPGDQNKPNADLLDLLAGEPLDGSGFELEIPEPDYEWRDPR